MSAKITARDSVYLARIPELYDGIGWHKKGTPTEVFNKETLAKALFAYAMSDSGIMVKAPGKPPRFVKNGQRTAYATDDFLPVGNSVGDNYWTPQNGELFEIFSEVIAGTGYKIVSCVTLDNRAEFAIDAKGENMKTNTRDIAPFLGLNRVFGGKSNVICAGHTMVIQCANTSRLFRSEAAKREDTVSFRNTKGLQFRMDDLKKAMEKSHGVAAQFVAAMKEAEEMPISVGEAQLAFAGMLTTGKPLVTGNNRTVNRVNRLVDLFRNGKGNRGESIADWLNAGTEFYTHHSGGSDDNCKEKQWYSSEYGSASNIKETLVSSLFEGSRVNTDFIPSLVAKGRNSIDRSNAADLVEAGFVSLN